MIVRMAECIVPSLSTQKLNRPIRDHLIRVHVKGHASPRLIHIHDKFPIPLPHDHFLSSTFDGPRAIPINQFQFTVDARSSLLDHAHYGNELWMCPIPADPIIFNRALCLDAIVRVKRYTALTKRIFLQSNSHFKNSKPSQNEFLKFSFKSPCAIHMPKTSKRSRPIFPLNCLILARTIPTILFSPAFYHVSPFTQFLSYKK